VHTVDFTLLQSDDIIIMLQWLWPHFHSKVMYCKQDIVIDTL